MAEYCWMSLTMPENAWINCSDYAMVLNMPQYTCDNFFIIVTNVVMLDFLSVRLLHPVYHFIFFQHELEHQNNES